jgi:hypothetical protein
LYYQIPIIFLGWGKAIEVANFVVALSFVGLFYTFPSIIFQKVAPTYLRDILIRESLIKENKIKIAVLVFILTAFIMKFISFCP